MRNIKDLLQCMPQSYTIKSYLNNPRYIPLEDCPICFERMPSLGTGSGYNSCCGKVICRGCIHAPLYDNRGNKVDNKKCAFCRTPHPKSIEELVERTKKRVEAGDPIAMYNVGNHYIEGLYGFPQDHAKALALWHRAGELGYSRAYTNIGHAYYNGEGVEVDKEKAKHYYELAAMAGDETARYCLGNNEFLVANMSRALEHHMISARSGLSESLDIIKQFYSDGHATKEVYAKALRFYQEYLSEIKSKQRDEAAAADEKYRYY